MTEIALRTAFATRRFLLFAFTGLVLFAYWAVARPSAERSASMTEWPIVLFFSATLLILAVALFVFGRTLGGQLAMRLAAVAAAGTALSSVANVIEDGFAIDAAFFLFLFGTLCFSLALVLLTIVLAVSAADSSRLLALVPAGTVAGLLLFVVAGGPILLIAWWGAALATLKTAAPSPAGDV